MGKSLVLKIRLYFLIFFVILFSSQLILRNVFIYPKLRLAEKHLDENSIHIFKTFLNEELNMLERMANDYGFWDDIYNFVNNKNIDFLKSNLTSETYRTLDTDLIAIYDRESQLVWNGYLTDDSSNNINSDKEFLADQDLNFLIPYVIDGVNQINTISGYTIIDGHPYLYATSLISNSEGSLKTNGFIVFLKKMDTLFFAKIAAKVNIDINAINLYDKHNLKKYSSLIESINASDSIYKYKKIGTNYFIYYSDNKNIPILLLTLKPYNAIPQDSSSFFQENLLSFFSIFLFMLFLQSAIKKKVIMPIIELNKHIKQIKSESHYTPLEYSNKNNEIDNVIHTFNSLIKMIALKDKEINESNRKLYSLANNDPLTKIPNRRFFENKFKVGWKMGMFYKKQVTLIMIDIDRYKLFNDFYGHQKGDEVLKSVSKVFQRALRQENDVVARYGGEEFVIFLYDCTVDNAIDITENLMKELKKLAIPHEKSDISKYVTASFGITSTIPNQNLSMDKMITDSDDALYSAKKTGRNRYHIGKLNKLPMK